MKKIKEVKKILALGMMLAMMATPVFSEVVHIQLLSEKNPEMSLSNSAKLAKKTRVSIETYTEIMPFWHRLDELDGKNTVVILDKEANLLFLQEADNMKICRVTDSFENTVKCIVESNISFLKEMYLNEDVFGSLSKNSERSINRPQSFAKTFSFQVTNECRKVGISMASPRMDSYLYLMKDFIKIGENNNSDAGARSLDSYLELKLDKGYYQVEATSYPKQKTGNFKLRVADLGGCTERGRFDTNLYLRGQYLHTRNVPPQIGKIFYAYVRHIFEGYRSYSIDNGAGLKLSLSEDKILDDSDYTIDIKRSFWERNSAEKKGEWGGTIPNWKTGNLFLLFTSDFDNEVAEYNENDNTVFLPIKIEPKDTIDLSLSSEVLNSFWVNSTLQMKTTVTHNGEDNNGMPVLGKVDYYVYNTQQATPIHVGTENFSIGGNNSTSLTQTKNVNITLPNSVGIGYWYIKSVLSQKNTTPKVEKEGVFFSWGSY